MNPKLNPIQAEEHFGWKMFNVEWHIMRQLVKRIVKRSAFLGSHSYCCIVSKASVAVIRTIVATECVRIAANERMKLSLFISILTELKVILCGNFV